MVPKYNDYVRQQLQVLRSQKNINNASVKELIGRLNKIVNEAYDNYKATGGKVNLNDYMKANYPVPKK